MNNYTARGGISPVTGHIAIEGPVVKNKSAFVLSARTTYSDWILKRLEDPELKNSDAAFSDFAGNLTLEPNEKNLVKVFGYYSKDNFRLGETNSFDYSNTGASVNMKHRFSSRISGDFAAVFGAYAFNNIDESSPTFAYSHNYRIEHYELKADFSWLSLGAHRLTYGGNAIYYRLNRGIVEPYGDLSLKRAIDLGKEGGIEAGVYIADEITINPRLTIYGGLRYSYFVALGPGDILEYKEGLPKKESNFRIPSISKQGSLCKDIPALNQGYPLITCWGRTIR